MLQLIPVIVEQLKTGSVTPQEEGVLKSIFGDLWSVIVDEALRAADDPVHPLLDILLQSNEVKHNKRDIAYENDVAQNTVALQQQMSPSDQLLHRTWAIVSRSMLERNANEMTQKTEQRRKRKEKKMRKMKNRRKQFVPSSSFDFLEPTNEVNIPEVTLPRHKRISRRNKRSFHITRSDDLSRMKALVNYLNAHEDDNDSSEEMSFGYTENYHKKPTYNNHPSIYELFHLAEQHRRRRQNKF